MVSHQHSRSSASSFSSNGSSYQMILDHILTYPGSYEIPLRTMYTLNCGPRNSNASGTPSSSHSSSPQLPQAAFQDTPSRQTLTENLMSQLSQLPNQPSALPPSFITDFVQKRFPSDLTHVDFPQALTGLDYLKDLECRRRKEVAAAFSRLDINRDALDQEAAVLSERYPGVLQWVKTIEDKERKIDALYTQVYVGLRRWILINELSLLPFHKHNCLAMLNTLYPPAGIAEQAQPTSHLTSTVLKGQRDGFWKYVQAVEKSGPKILSKLMQQGKAPADVNGWPAVVRNLNMYLQLANSMLKECESVFDLEDVSPRKNRESGPRHTRKADSGISFTSNVTSNGASERRPSTRGSDLQKEPMSPIEWNRPKTPSGARSGTALEKLARGLRTIGRSRTDVTEIIDNSDDIRPTTPVDRPKMLRRMRSLGALGDRKASSFSLATREDSDAPAFDVDAMRQLRADYEARQKNGKRASNEV